MLGQVESYSYCIWKKKS